MQEAGRGGAATTDLPLNFQKTPAQTERHTQQARTHILPAKSLHLHPLWINNGQMHIIALAMAPNQSWQPQTQPELLRAKGKQTI